MTNDEIQKRLNEAEKCTEDLNNEQKMQEGTLKFDNIDWAIKGHLWESIEKELNARKVTCTIDHDYVVKYIGLKHSAIDVEGGAKKLAEKVNDICSAYKVVGSFTEGAIKLNLIYLGEKEGPQSLFLYYIAFTPQAASRIDLEIKHDKKSSFFDTVGGKLPNETRK